MPSKPTPGFSCLLPALLLAACASREPIPSPRGHLHADAAILPSAAIPDPVFLPLPPPPRAQSEPDTYSVLVDRVGAHDLLFALARDAGLDIDIHPGIAGEVTLRAVRQTLPRLLERIARQVDMRFEFDGSGLSVMPDTPFLRNYSIDYVNMSRDMSGSVTLATQLVGAVGGTAAPGSGGNNSTTRIENRAQHRFWDNLVRNVRDILAETGHRHPATMPAENRGSPDSAPDLSDPPAGATPAPARQTAGTPPGSRRPAAATDKPPRREMAAAKAPPERLSALPRQEFPASRTQAPDDSASVIAHPETGTLGVRATARQHAIVGEFIDRVVASARRQVMIEATLVEVQLSGSYQQGIDWSRIASGDGFGMAIAGSPLATVPGLLALSYRNGGFGAMVRLLETFGTTRVLSSPKISVLNNQTAVLKVVDNSVYFTIKADTSQNQTTSVTTYTTTLNQVPVGFVMNVTPQIGESETVLLNVRPSVSRIIGSVRDPNPALRRSGANAFDEDIVSEIPVIRTREMESMLRIQNGSIAVMGGLMEDSSQDRDAFVPGLGRLPLIGEALTQRDRSASRTELVVFLRPTIVHDPSLEGDHAVLRGQLPTEAFFAANDRGEEAAVGNDARFVEPVR